MPLLPEHVLGNTYLDKVSGFVGLATAMAFHLSGHIEVALQPPVKTSGEMPDAVWLSYTRLAQQDTPQVTLGNG
jgi:hypothetical protein